MTDKTTETTETTESAAAPDVFDGDTISSDPEWQAAMEGDETGEGESQDEAGEGEETKPAETTEKSEDVAVEAAEVAEKPAAEETAEAEKSKPSNLVPHEALHQEREKRQGLERELSELRGQFKEFSKPPPAPIAPSVDRDAEVQKMMEAEDLTQVEAEIRFDQNEIRQEQAEQKKFRTDQQNRDNEAVELQAVQAEYSASANKFKEQTPDFDDAYNFGLNARAAQLALENPQATQAQINNAVMLGELRLADAAIKAGKDPAEIVYQYAKTFGYQAPEGGDGDASKDTGEDTGKTEAEKKLLNIQKGEDASRSASGGSSGDTGEGLTFESLKNKSGKEFDSGWSELVPQQDSIFD